MSSTNTDRHEPKTPCPEWCGMHIDGRHVAELDLKGVLKGYHIYLREADYGNGEVGMEVVVAQPGSTKTTRIEIDPTEVREAARLAAEHHRANRSDSGTGTGDEKGESPQ